MVRQPVTSNRQRQAVDTATKRASSGKVVAQKDAKPIQSARQLAELTAKARKKLPKGAFAVPGKKAYPVEDPSHARNALARVSQNGTPAEKAAVKAKVANKFPMIGKKAAPKKGGK